MAVSKPIPVRIIGGHWRGRKIRTPIGLELRPSTDRVREALFNFLGQYLDGLSCLDLFAGTGVLGLEAASRGAQAVTLVEKNTEMAKHIRTYINLLDASATVLSLSAQQFLAANRQRFDVVFLDPPFVDYQDDTAWALLLGALAPHIQTNGRVYCESNRLLIPPNNWQVQTTRRVGRVHWHILRLL